MPTSWPIAAYPQRFTGEQIHVWAWSLNPPPSYAHRTEIEEDVALLDTGELGRFHRFHFELDRIRFATAHANKRRILGAYLERDPRSLLFKSGFFGKPELLTGSDERTLYFNLSHSRSIALLALSINIEVGVDIEDIRLIEPSIAECHFSPLELSGLSLLDGQQWLCGFFRCWTRKEAILKAEGIGLNIPLNCFDVSLLPDKPAELIGYRPPAVFRKPWTLHDLPLNSSTAASLAAASSEAQVRCFRFDKESTALLH